MDFYLRYRGPLPTCSRTNRRTKEKHDIRAQLSPQLKDLWNKAPQLNRIRNRVNSLPLRGVEGGKVIIPDPDQSDNSFVNRFYNIQLKDCLFTPLVTRPLELICHLDVQFLRRADPGAILQGGDLDNRLKTLFDGLRIPLNEDEVPDQVNKGERFFCLLEDDALVTRVGVETGRLLGPLENGEKPNDVDLSIHVTVRLGRAMLANLDWLS